MNCKSYCFLFFFFLVVSLKSIQEYHGCGPNDTSVSLPIYNENYYIRRLLSFHFPMTHLGYRKTRDEQ
jgi:hypothetical protein